MSALTEAARHDGKPAQRTEAGIKYERLFKAFKKAAMSRDPKVLAKWLEANAGFLQIKATPGQVHVNQVLTNLSVQYANDDFIGERLMPLLFTGGKLSGTYFTYNKRDRFAYPDDEMTDRTKANELNQGRSSATYGLTPRALREFLDQLTLQNQDAPLNEMMDTTQNVLEGLAFNRELRIAAIAGVAGSYGSNTTAIAAADRWDTATGGDPGAVVDTAQAAMWRGRGPSRKVAFCSLSVYNVLKRHPGILARLGMTKPGMVANREQLAAYFEVDEVLVGESRKDTANEGQTASYSRIWPDVFGIVRVATSPSIRNAAFGYTFQDLPTQQDTTFDIQEGTKGGYWSRASHSDQHKVVAADTGYLITTPIG